MCMPRWINYLSLSLSNFFYSPHQPANTLISLNSHFPQLPTARSSPFAPSSRHLAFSIISLVHTQTMNSQDPELVAEYIAAFGAPICECGEEAPLRTSWTEDNPGRRFFGCPNYGTARGRCRFFVWVDNAFTERSKNVINGLLRKVDRLEKEKWETEKRERQMEIGNMFVWGVCALSVGVPIVATILAMRKKS